MRHGVDWESVSGTEEAAVSSVVNGSEMSPLKQDRKGGGSVIDQILLLYQILLIY